MKKAILLAALLLAFVGGASASSTGGLTEVTSLATGLGSADWVTTSPDGKNVYVASFSSGAVAAYARASDGSLTSLGSVTDGSLRQTTSVTVSPDGKTVYATGSGGGAIVWLDRSSSDGSLSFGGCVSETGNAPCLHGSGLGAASDVVVSPDGLYVYVSAFGGGGGSATGDVATFARATDGSLTESGCIEETPGTAECGGANGTGLSDAAALAITPDGGNLYTVSDNDPGAVAAFSRSSSTGALTEMGCVGKSGSSECGTTVDGISDLVDAAVSPDGKDLYVVSDVAAGVVAHFSIGSGGVLAADGCIASIASVCGTTVHGTANAFGIAVAPDGSTVYVASAGHSSPPAVDSAVSAFSRAGDGSLAQLASPDDCVESSGTSLCGRSGSGLANTLSVAVSPDGQNAYSAAAPTGAGTLAEFSIATTPSPPASITVTRLDDPAGAGNCPTDCSLRQALAAVADGGTVTLPAGTYQLTSQLLLLRNVTIAGAGAGTTSIYQTGPQRVIEVGEDTSQGAPANIGATVTLTGVSITHGDTSLGGAEYDPGVGGGLWIDSGSTVSLDQVAVTQNLAQVSGGGVDNDGTTTITRSTITSNKATGASYEIGGGIDNWGALAVTNTTIDGNSSGHEGGGVESGSTTTLTNVTVSNNVSGFPGGAVYGGGDVVMVNTLLAWNKLQSGAYQNCGGTITSNGHNLSTDTSCASSLTGAGDQNAVSAQAGIDAGDDARCPAVDQNGTPRPVGPHCDIGALETTVAGPGPVDIGHSTVVASPSSVPADGTTGATVTVTLRDANNTPVPGIQVHLAANFGHSSISASLVTSDANGVAAFTVTDSTVESVLYSATDRTDSLALLPNVSVDFTATGSGGNAAPTASFTDSTADLAVSVDGSASSDSDGTIAAYAWDFGDGSTANGATASHTYAAAGTYTITLTVTDDGGATGSVSHSVTVSAPAGGGGGGSGSSGGGGGGGNAPPVAAFTSSVEHLAVSFDATGSHDPDGTISAYRWDFGDGTSGTGSTVSHTYAAAGTYEVVLVVTDAAGATGSTSQSVSVSPPPPTVTITVSPGRVPVGRATALAATAAGGAAPLRVTWSFGDGATARGAFQSHAYSRAGRYVARATVTDALGRSATAALVVVVVTGPTVTIEMRPTTAAPGVPAKLTARALTALGPAKETRIVAWQWRFDGASSGATTASVTHVFAAGRHLVAVRGVDASGRAASATLTVVVTPPPTTISVVDTLTVTDGVSGPAEIDVVDNATVTDGVSGPTEIDVSDGAGVTDGVSGPVSVSTVDGASVTDTVSSKTKPKKRR